MVDIVIFTIISIIFIICMSEHFKNKNKRKKEKKMHSPLRAGSTPEEKKIRELEKIIFNSVNKFNQATIYKDWRDKGLEPEDLFNKKMPGTTNIYANRFKPKIKYCSYCGLYDPIEDGREAEYCPLCGGVLDVREA